MTWLALLVIAWLPGALIFRLPIASRERRAALGAEERLFWAVILSIAWSLAVTLALAWLARYQFVRLVAANTIVSACLLLLGRRRLLYGGTAARVKPAAFIPIVIALGGCWLYLPPSEYVLGGKDPGVYMNEGIQIAQRGGLLIDEPIVRDVPANLRELFMPPYGSKTYYSVRFMGFFIQDPDRGTVVGQFPHLFPASIAIGYGLNGLSGARQTVVFWTILALIAIYLVACRVTGPVGALVAVGLLSINVVEIWFGRYPNAEVAGQTLLFAAILAFARAAEGSQLFFGLASALLLGLQIFLRYDAVLAVAAFAIAGTLLPFNRQRIGWPFVIALCTVIGCSLLYLAGPMRAYSEGLFGYTRDQGGVWLILAGCAVAFGCARLARQERWRSMVWRVLPISIAAALGVLAVYAYFVRGPSQTTASFDADAFRTFAWYVTRPGLLVGVIGLLVLIARLFWRDPALWMTIAVYSTFFFYKTRIVPEHFWSQRRFLAATLPGLAIAIAGVTTMAVRALLARRGPLSGTRDALRLSVVSGLITCILVAPLAIAYWRASSPVRSHIEYAGLIPQLERLASNFHDTDLVIVESRAASDVHVLATPLAYIYARNVLVLASARPPRGMFDAFVAWAASRYDRVLFLGSGGSDLLGRGMIAKPLVSERFQVPEYDAPKQAYPEGPRQKEFDYGIYQITAVEDSAVGLPIALAIGTMDDLQVVRFHAKEQSGDGTPFRWSRDRSYVVLPTLPSAATRLTIWMSDGGRSAKSAPALVEVSVEDRVLGSVTPGVARQPFTFTLPRPEVWVHSEPVRIQLRVETWNPHRELGVPDTRDLGVQVTRVEIQ